MTYIHELFFLTYFQRDARRAKQYLEEERENTQRGNERLSMLKQQLDESSTLCNTLHRENQVLQSKANAAAAPYTKQIEVLTSQLSTATQLRRSAEKVLKRTQEQKVELEVQLREALAKSSASEEAEAELRQVLKESKNKIYDYRQVAGETEMTTANRMQEQVLQLRDAQRSLSEFAHEALQDIATQVIGFNSQIDLWKYNQNEKIPKEKKKKKVVVKKKADPVKEITPVIQAKLDAHVRLVAWSQKWKPVKKQAWTLKQDYKRMRTQCFEDLCSMEDMLIEVEHEVRVH